MVDFASWGWPQFVYVTLTLMALGYVGAKHGELKSSPRHHFGYQLFGALFLIILLYFGGFFS